MNRERWDGWVTFAWLIAVVVIAASVGWVIAFGFVDVPRVTAGGFRSVEREPNLFIWAMAIAQSIGALFFAVTFSILNGIYKNTIDALPAKELPAIEAPSGFEGLEVRRVHDASPLAGYVREGYRLLTVNGRPAISAQVAAESVLDGVNTFELMDANGNHVEKQVKMRPQPLHLQFAT